MQYTREEKAVVWLCACTDLDYKERVSALRAVKDPSRLFTADEKFFANVIKKPCNGLYKKGCAQREADAEAFLLSEERKGRFCAAICAEDYPERLKNIPDPPLVLYGAGNRELLKSEMFCIVGSRITPPWAVAAGVKLARELCRHFTIVTGLAEGGDSAAIEGAAESGKLISVLPNGLNECYPASHNSLKERVAQKGLLLCEYPPDERVQKYSFHARNRLLAGLSRGVLVLSAGLRSGALITANRALDYGRDVFALPHNAGVRQGEGCNELIKSGAALVTNAQDILGSYGIHAEAEISVSLSAQEQSILSALEKGELHVTELAEKTGMRIYEVSALVTALEIKNLVVRAGANRYAAVN